jgi:hypothetical protein
VSEDSIQIGVIWPDIEEQPVLAANQFVTQLSPGPDGRPEELVLIVGNVTPPLVLGQPDEVHAMLSAVGAVSAKAHGRFSLTRGRLDELVSVLAQAAHNWDQAMSEGGQG